MFTGIIQATGRVERRGTSGSGARLTIATPRPLPRLALGESIAVNGACLTVAARRDRRFTVDVSPETLRRTTLGRMAPGTRVNLERALRMGDRMGGHIVQGHVDGVGRLEKVTRDGDWLLYRFRAPPPRPTGGRARPGGRSASSKVAAAASPPSPAGVSGLRTRRPRCEVGEQGGTEVDVGAELLADAGEQSHDAADEQDVGGDLHERVGAHDARQVRAELRDHLGVGEGSPVAERPAEERLA